MRAAEPTRIEGEDVSDRRSARAPRGVHRLLICERLRQPLIQELPGDLVDRTMAARSLGLKTRIRAARKTDRVIGSGHSQSVGTTWVGDHRALQRAQRDDPRIRTEPIDG